MSKQSRAMEVLDDLLAVDSGLSPKEINCIESMDEKRQYHWSDAQIKWLDDIYDRVC